MASNATLKIEVTVPPESISKLDKLGAEDEIPQAVKRGMDRALSAVRGKIQTDRLSGIGPYAPSLVQLGERSGLLRASLREEPAVVSGNTVTGSIGYNQFYGFVHEYGMTITGKPVMRFQIAGKWIAARQVVIPERPVVRFGVQENAPLIETEIVNEVTDTIEKILGP